MHGIILEKSKPTKPILTPTYYKYYLPAIYSELHNVPASDNKGL